jgi:MarR family transcriptional regulator, organic hydroperoxide resistance regulator
MIYPFQYTRLHCNYLFYNKILLDSILSSNFNKISLDFGLISNYIGAMVKTKGMIALIASVRDKANRLITLQLKERGITDISTPHGAIFIHLFRHGELSMGEIAKRIDRDKSTVTALVRRLTELGYLDTGGGADSRVTMVRLTKKGEALKKDFKEISAHLQERMYQGFSDLEKELLVRLLTRVNVNL